MPDDKEMSSGGIVGGAFAGMLVPELINRLAVYPSFKSTQKVKRDNVAELVKILGQIELDKPIDVKGGQLDAFNPRTRTILLGQPTSMSAGLHELGHAMSPKNLIEKLSNKLYIPSRALGPLGIIPSYYAAKSDDPMTSAGLFGLSGAISAPMIIEEMRASRNARNIAKKYNLPKLKGLKRALSTYLLTAAAPVTGGIGAYMAGSYFGKPKDQSVLDKIKKYLQ